MAIGKLKRGFSLVELMAAVAIMSIIVALALPRYRVFIARARTSEAKMNLGIIYGLQQTYKAEFEQFAQLPGMGYQGHCNPTPAQAQNELGFRVTDCLKLNYHYTSSAGAGYANSNGSEIYPDCTDQDRWSISAARHLKHDQSAIEQCDN